jgi:hypothetical protein
VRKAVDRQTNARESPLSARSHAGTPSTSWNPRVGQAQTYADMSPCLWHLWVRQGAWGYLRGPVLTGFRVNHQGDFRARRVRKALLKILNSLKRVPRPCSGVFGESHIETTFRELLKYRAESPAQSRVRRLVPHRAHTGRLAAMPIDAQIGILRH